MNNLGAEAVRSFIETWERFKPVAKKMAASVAIEPVENKPRIRTVTDQQILDAYATGMTMAQVGKLLHTSPSTVGKVLRNHGYFNSSSGRRKQLK